MKNLDFNQIHFIFRDQGAWKQGKHLLTAFLYKSNMKIDLETGEQFETHREEIKEVLENHDTNFFNIIISYYELGRYFKFDERENDNLFIQLKFKEFTSFDFNRKKEKVEIKKIKAPSFKEYKDIFERSNGYLKNGDCYQINITRPFTFKFNKKESFISNFLNSQYLSEYAHFVHLPILKKSFISNTPESLFSINNNRLFSRPIKGTISERQEESLLINSSKNKAELDIITDLLRNDLSSIGINDSRIESIRSLLRVPGLVHQFSEISVDLDRNITLYQILKSLFPGGSITGAPKKRVMEIIERIELYRRGVYTGSTIMWCKEMRRGTINIRTAVLEHRRNHFIYGAGGGITLLSDVEEEFEEMLSKVDSFLSIF